MSFRDKEQTGFKFSFKKYEQSCRSTPKFTSIELPAQFSKADEKPPFPSKPQRIHTSKSQKFLADPITDTEQRIKYYNQTRKINSTSLIQSSLRKPTTTSNILQHTQSLQQMPKNCTMKYPNDKQKQKQKQRDKEKNKKVRVSDGFDQISMSVRKSHFTDIGQADDDARKEKLLERKVIQKKVILEKERKVYFRKNRSLEKLFKDPLPNTPIKPESQQKQKQRQQSLGNPIPRHDDSQEEKYPSYLQIFKKQKKKPQNSSKLSQLNLSLLSLKKSIEDTQRISQSPRLLSIHHQSSTPKIRPYFQRPAELQELLEAASLPTTEKSAKFQDQYGSDGAKVSQFFRKVELKKQVSKALFKSQKTNVNLRLNNIGGTMSKLNIHID